ncbi:1029_t:CDS:2, partial [Cetraspora pellucida]
LFSTVAHNNTVAHSIDSNEQIKFSAPIMRVVLSYYLFTSPVKFKSLPAKTFDEFLLRTIERMSPSILSESFGKGAKSGPNSHLYERSWQMEWYRTATTAVPENTSISADVGPVFGSVGFLDFYVNGELCWGIELTREGDRLKKHAERFEQDGEYANIPLKDWAIIDFRHHTKQIISKKDNWLESLKELREEPEDLEEEPEDLWGELDKGIDRLANCSDINGVAEPVLVK